MNSGAYLAEERGRVHRVGIMIWCMVQRENHDSDELLKVLETFQMHFRNLPNTSGDS